RRQEHEQRRVHHRAAARVVRRADAHRAEDRVLGQHARLQNLKQLQRAENEEEGERQRERRLDRGLARVALHGIPRYMAWPSRSNAWRFCGAMLAEMSPRPLVSTFARTSVARQYGLKRLGGSRQWSGRW